MGRLSNSRGNKAVANLRLNLKYAIDRHLTIICFCRPSPRDGDPAESIRVIHPFIHRNPVVIEIRSELAAQSRVYHLLKSSRHRILFSCPGLACVYPRHPLKSSHHRFRVAFPRASLSSDIGVQSLCGIGIQSSQVKVESAAHLAQAESACLSHRPGPVGLIQPQASWKF